MRTMKKIHTPAAGNPNGKPAAPTATPAPGSLSGLELDLKARRRDDENNSYPRHFAGAGPLPDLTPLGETALGLTLVQLAKVSPQQATRLAGDYQTLVLPAIRRVHAAQRAAEENLARISRERAAANADLDLRIEAVRTRELPLRAALETKIEGEELVVRDLEDQAVAAAARAGSDSLDSASVLRLPPPPPVANDEAVAGANGLAYVPAARPVIPRWASAAMSAGVAAMTAVSLYSVGNFGDPANALTQVLPAEVLGGLCLLVGAATALGTKHAVQGLWNRAGLHLSSHRRTALLTVSVATLASVGILGIDALLHREGLLAGAGLAKVLGGLSGLPDDRAAEETTRMTAFVMATIVMVGYIVANALQGLHEALQGLRNNDAQAVRHAAALEEAAARREAETERRAQPEVQEAFQAIGLLRAGKARLAALQARMGEFGREILELEARRQAPLEEFLEEDRRLKQDALDDAHWTWRWWFDDLFRIVWAYEPVPGKPYRFDPTFAVYRDVDEDGAGAASLSQVGTASNPPAPREGFLRRLFRRIGETLRRAF